MHVALLKWHINQFKPVLQSRKQELRAYCHKGFHQVWYQGGVKATVSGVVEDLKFKISEGSDPNWSFPDSAQLAVSV